MSLRTAPQKPMRLRKGLLFFALACVLLWGSMWLSHSLKPASASEEYIYELGGSAWQGIERVELQNIGSGTIILGGQERPRLISRYDNKLQPRLALVRRGNTLVISPKVQNAQHDAQARGRRAEVRMQHLYLPLQVRSIQSDAYLYVRMAEAQQQTQGQQPLTLSGQNVNFNGDIAHLQVQLRPRPNADALACNPNRGWAAYLSVRSQHIQTLGITAPKRSKIALEMGQENGQDAAPSQPQITLQTGADSRLELQPVALLRQVQILAAADANSTPDCPKASAKPSDYSDYSDYSD